MCANPVGKGRVGNTRATYQDGYADDYHSTTSQFYCDMFPLSLRELVIDNLWSALRVDIFVWSDFRMRSIGCLATINRC